VSDTTTRSRIRLGRASRRNDGEWAAESMRALIVGGQVRAGERVVPEDMAEALGLSRTPVREGIVALECEGLVVVEPQRSTRVTGLTRRIVADHYEITALVLGLASRWTVERAPQAALTALDAAAAKAGKGDDWPTAAAAAGEARSALLSASGSVRAAAVLRVLPDLLAAAPDRPGATPGAGPGIAASLQVMARAARQGDPRAAQDAAQEMCRSLARQSVALLEEEGSLAGEDEVLPWPAPSPAESWRHATRRPASFARTRTQGIARAEALLRDQIVQMKIRPGARVDLQELASLAGVSSTPLRQAVIALERQGLLRIEPHRGVFVNSFSARDARDHNEIFATLFTFATWRLIERDDTAVLGEFQRLARSLGAARRPWTFEQRNNELLDCLIGQAGSRPLVVALRATPGLISGNYFQKVPGAQDAHRAGTAAILAAVQRRDPEAAASAWSQIEAADAEGVIALLGIG
jgi:DNA-binding GntR family transcriptional regulator